MRTRERTDETQTETLDRGWDDWDEDDVAMPRAAGDVAADRACIACGETFRSEGWHNRLCPKCRRKSDPFG